MLSTLWRTLLIIPLLVGCYQTPPTVGPASGDVTTRSTSYEVREIPLGGPLAEARSEISGLAWHQESLLFLPQYPERLGGANQAALFKLDKSILEAYLDGAQVKPLTPKMIKFDAGDITNNLIGYEGFEAIAFMDESAYLIIESSGGLRGDYSAYLVRGTIEGELEGMTLDDGSLVKIPSQTKLRNSTDEALVIQDDRIISIHEANGEGINPNPVANVYDPNLNHSGSIPFPTVNYRITDASEIEEDNAFWGINYFFPGDTHLIPPGMSDPPKEPIEQILKFKFTGDSISIVEIPPVQLVLSKEGARNWEGLVRFEDRGFLLITDKYPRTIFGFVEYP